MEQISNDPIAVNQLEILKESVLKKICEGEDLDTELEKASESLSSYLRNNIDKFIEDYVSGKLDLDDLRTLYKICSTIALTSKDNHGLSIIQVTTLGAKISGIEVERERIRNMREQNKISEQ